MKKVLKIGQKINHIIGEYGPNNGKIATVTITGFDGWIVEVKTDNGTNYCIQKWDIS